MKRLLLALGLLFCAINAGAQTTTFNGVVKDLTNTPVPIGQVTFTLKPGIDTTISGSSRFVPATTFCEIHNPGVVSTSGTGTITVVVDTAQNWLAGDSLIFVGTADATLNASTVASPYIITVRNSSTSFVFAQSGAHVNGTGGTVGGLYKSGGTGACVVLQNTAITPQNTSYTVGIQAIFAQPSSFNTYAIGVGPVDISTVVPTPSQMPAYSFVDTFSTQTITGAKTISNPCTIAGMIYVTATGCYTTLSAALIFAPSTGAWIYLPPATYSCPGSLSSHLHLVGYVPGVPANTISGATNLVWGTPPADQKVVFSCPAGLTLSGLWDTTIEGITIDGGGNNVNCLVLQNGVFENTFGSEASPITIQNCGTGTALTMNGGASAGQSIVKNLINANIFNAGKGIVLTATAPGVSANNVFGIVHIQNISIRGIEFTQNADSNTFRWTFMSGLANAAQAIAFNTGTPAVDVDADANVFGFCLCADVQNPGSYTGTLVQVNKSFGNAINNWEIGPGIQTAGGVELALANAPTFAYTITEDFTAAVNNGNNGVGGNLLLGGQVRNFANNATMGMTLKKGSGAGNYTSTSLTYAQVDATNLLLAVTIPTGWKLGIVATGEIGSNTAVVAVSVALADGGAVLQEMTTTGVGIGTTNPFTLAWVVAGDGLSHSIDLRYKTSNGADAVVISNPSATLVPSMIFTLMPSN